MPAPKGNGNAKGNKGGGRKSSYDPALAKLAFNYCLLGATDVELAEFLGVGLTTLRAWKGCHVEFSEALKKGKTEADAKVAFALHRKTLGCTITEQVAIKVRKTVDGSIQESVEVVSLKKYVPADTTAQIFWLKNRQPRYWRDRQEVETHVSGEMSLSTKVAKELDAIADKLLKRKPEIESGDE